jgi:hypothetical protein
MPGPWGPPSMMYSPCLPWRGWYGPWAPSLMPFHPGWLGPAEGFSYGGCYPRDGRYRHVDHQHDSRILRQENQMVWNPKLNGTVSQEAAAPGRWHGQEALKDGPSADQSENSEGRTGPRSKARRGEKFRGGGNRAGQGFGGEGRDQDRGWDQLVVAAKLDHPVSSASGQKNPLRTTAPEMAPTPRW